MALSSTLTRLTTDLNKDAKVTREEFAAFMTSLLRITFTKVAHQ